MAYSLRREPVPTRQTLENDERLAKAKVAKLVALDVVEEDSENSMRSGVRDLKVALAAYEEANLNLRSKLKNDACLAKVQELTDEAKLIRYDVRDKVYLIRAFKPCLDDISSIDCRSHTLEKVEKFLDAIDSPDRSTAEIEEPITETQIFEGARPKKFRPYETAQINFPNPYATSFEPISPRNAEPGTLREPSPSRSFNHSLVHELNKLNISAFDGRPAMFWSWKGRITQKMSSARLSPMLKLILLQENTLGEPREMIENHIESTGEVTEEDVSEVWSILQRRYGSSDKISEELLERVERFPIIRGRDIGRSLQKLYDLCKILAYNMRYNSQLKILDLAIGLKPIRTKLPEELQAKWREFGQSYKLAHDGEHPPFLRFTSFLRNVADQRADGEFAISSNNSDYYHHDYPQRTRPRERRERMLRTDGSVLEQTRDLWCPFHELRGHDLQSCYGFKTLGIRERKDKIIQWRLCFICLQKGHGAARCPGAPPCDICNQTGHHSLLHFDTTGPDTDNPNRIPLQRPDGRENTEGRVLKSSNLSNRVRDKNCSKTVLVDLYFEPSRCLRAYAIIDEQSTTSILDQRAIDYLGGEFPEREFTLTFASDRYQITEKGYQVTGLKVKAANDSEITEVIDLPDMLTTREIADTRHEVASPEEVMQFNHIRHLAPKFSSIDSQAKVLLLIGRDCARAMWCRSFSVHEPYAYQTALGWALVGRTGQRFTADQRSSVLCTRVNTNPILTVANHQLSNDPFTVMPDDEDIGKSRDDAQFLEIMACGAKLAQNGSIELPIPLKSHAKLSDNQITVQMRTRNTLKRLKQDEERWMGCIASMGDSIRQGHVEEIPEAEEEHLGPTWYLPIFPVYNKKGKTRLVFDASAKCKDVSLNDQLLQGPDLNNTLRGVLLRFREQKIGFMTDIASMFNTFHLPKEQRDLYRFFWPKDNRPGGPLVAYRSLVHLFGSRSSPAVATYGLKYAAKHSGASPKVYDFLNNHFYVDDGIASSSTVEEAVEIIRGAREALATYNIRLHKIMSSSEDVLQQFPPGETARGSHTLESKDGVITRTLGVVWDPVKDCFSVNVAPADRPFTKRGVLSVVNSLYDPLGMVSPIVLAGRLIMRAVLPHKGSPEELHKLGWDDPLPTDKLEEWSSWVTSLQQINKLEIPRCFIRHPNVEKQELHVFADASQEAIGYIIYIRTLSSQGPHVCLLEANSRVSPRAATTIPRLELNAALESTVAVRRILRELTRQPETVSFYSDSMIVLGYLHNKSARYTKYISRRVEMILSVSTLDQWHYVATALNPADIASRPTKPEELLNSRWTLGPDCLWQEHYKPTDVENCVIPQPLPEEKEETRVLLVQEDYQPSHPFVELMLKLSSLDKLCNVVSIMMRLGKSLDHARQRLGTLQAPRKTLFSRNEILTILTYHAQRDSNPADVIRLTQALPLSNRSPLASLNPYLDDAGLIRVGGRIRRADLPFEEKHPVFLAHNHVFTKLVLEHHHEQTYHQGRVLTQAAVRKAGYHLQKGGRAVRSLMARCVTCKRLRGTAAQQLMADLPLERLENVPPFTNIGMDVFGPFATYDGSKSTRRQSSTKKVWVLIVVCLVSRAIHLEPLVNMEAATLMNAYRRFQAVRGCVVIVRTDRGTNFISVRNRAEPTNIQDAITELQRPKGSWKLHPPHASHFAGSWERKIGAVRAVLNGALVCLHQRNLSRDEFSTYLAEASAIVNNTPLCDVSLRHDDPSPLSPADLLTLKGNPNPPPLGQFAMADIEQYGKTRWKRIQHLAEEFWTRWRREYTTTLQERQKWVSPKPNLKPGDIVIVKEKNYPRNTWPLAKVEAVKTSEDGKVRSVALKRPPLPGKTQARVTTRCIQDLTLIFPAQSQEAYGFANDPSREEESEDQQPVRRSSRLKKTLSSAAVDG